MSTPATAVPVRRFRRSDRDQLTALVNAHAQAVVPGVVVSTNSALSQLEREPGEFVVDPWVRERVTLVAEQRGRLSAAAHVLLYRDEPDVGDNYRGIGEIRWLLQWPAAPYWPDSDDAGRSVLASALDLMRHAGVRRVHADPSLPAPGVYGVPEQWPHVQNLLTDAGFQPDGRAEVVLLAGVGRISRPAAPAAGLEVRRTLGVNGTRLAAHRGSDLVGYIEVDVLDAEARLVPAGGMADVGNLWVADGAPDGLALWLLGLAADWLALGRVDRVLMYADENEPAELEQATAAGFQRLARTRRAWGLGT
ncbi:hypothetical protein [Pseudactinotalea sp.]|uniref:hypothetical protein n=1 Tax=Pseudactinotalea sp. TaxID=1926260 RepID=UPI003B3A5DC5